MNERYAADDPLRKVNSAGAAVFRMKNKCQIKYFGFKFGIFTVWSQDMKYIFGS